MLISVSELRSFWKVQPTGVVHVGAHQAEELEDYETYGFGPVVWVEAQPDLVTGLNSKVRPPSIVLQGLVWNESGKPMTLMVTNNSQSSSVFALGSHKQSYPEIKVTSELLLTTSRLDAILPPELRANFLNLDIQGAEYEALQGLGSLIHDFDFIYSEVNRGNVYEGIKQVQHLDAFLEQAGFKRLATIWTKANWGDALYVRKSWIASNLGSPLRLCIRQLLFTAQVRLRVSLLVRKSRNLISFAGRYFSPNKAR